MFNELMKERTQLLNIHKLAHSKISTKCVTDIKKIKNRILTGTLENYKNTIRVS